MRRFTAHTGDLCRVVFCLFAASCLAGPTLLAQLPASDDRWWDARFGPPGTRGSLGDQGSVISLTPAPNGDLYAAGAFTALHGATTTNLARWDGDRWLPVLTGAINGTITGVSFAPNGDLYICGSFSQIGGSVINHIARWNGSAWVALGNGLNGTANQMAWAGNLLFVVGSFSRAGTVDANRIAWWNGSNWGLLGTGPTNGVNNDALAITADSRGQVFVGGSFTQAGLVPTGRIARYDTTTGRWTALGSGIPNGVVTELVAHGNDLYVGGTFTSAGGVPAAGLAKWDGTNWFAVAPTVPVTVSALLVAAPDEIVIAGNNRALVWDGAEWTQLGSTFAGENLSLSTLAIAHNTLFIGGRFQSAGGKVTHNLARFDAQDWVPAEEPAHGISADEVRALAVAGRNVYAGGTFRTAGTNWLDRIARWDGAQWHPLGEGIAGSGNPEVRALAARGTNLYVGGFFDQAGGTNAGRIACWDGARWHPLGSGVSGRVLALAVAENGDVYAGGIFEFAGGTPATNVARWNGTNWSQLGRGLAGQVNALKVRGNQLYAGGHFTSDHIFSMTNVAVFNGTFWSSLGNGPNNGVNGGVSALEVIGTNLFVGGQFTRAGTNSAGRIARWDGTRWSALGAGVNDFVYALAVQGGELCAGGWFTQAGGQPALRVARWNGQQWAPFGRGVRGGNNSVYALAADSWSLYVGGGFTYAGEKPAFQIARYGNEPPTVDLTQPHSGSLFFAADTLLLTAEAADRDDSVTRVEFLDGATSLGASLTAPFSLVWNNITPGAHTLRARAMDEFGLESSSSPVTVFISVNPLAQPPRRAVQNNSYSSMLLHSSGRLFGWGQNSAGELGNGTNRVAYEPVGTTFPPGVRAWQSIATGEGHTLAIGDDGQLYTWGGNNTGELGQGGQSAPRYEPGRIALPPGVTRWTAVAAGWASSFALGDNGQLYACGWNANRSLGLGSNGIYNVFTLVPPPSGATAWRAIAAGYQHTLGVTDNDRVYAWGNNIFGEAIPTDTTTVITNLTPVPLPADATNIITLAAGWHHSLALTREGRLFAWGYNGLGQLGTGTIGGPRLGPLEVPPPPGANRWVDVVVGSDHCLAMASNGELYAWGMNTHGEMGHRDTTYQPAPGLIPRPASVTAWLTFSAGYYHNLAVGNDCRVYVWGDNAWGQLATGTNHAVTNLVPVAALGDVCGALLTTPPTLTLDSPSDGALFGRGDAVPFEATAADADGVVAGVEFFVGPRLVGLITNAPWETTWLAGAAGTNVITAIATDNRGAIAVAAPGRIVTGIRPNISIFAPTNAQPINEGDHVFVVPVTFDPDGSVARVDYFLDGALLRSVSSAGWSFTWSNAPWGDFVLTAVATDNSELTATSAPVALHVNARPRLTVLSPTHGAVFLYNEEPVLLSADAMDPDGVVTQVVFFAPNGPQFLLTEPPFSVLWTNAGWGTYNLSVEARDDRGVATTASGIRLIVNARPTLDLWTVGGPFHEGSNIVLQVLVGDQERSLAQLNVFADGVLIASRSRPPAFTPLSFSWTNPPPGQYVLTASVTDTYGATAGATPVSARVNARPTLAILSPTNGAAFFTDEPIPVVAQATDLDGFVERAHLEYAPAHSQGFQYLSLLTNGTSTFTWTNPPYAPGDYPDLRDAASLRVWGWDNTSLIVTSAVVRVRVVGRPQVTLTPPLGGTNFNEGDSIRLFALDGNPSQASLTNVEIYANESSLGSASLVGPRAFGFTWSNAPPGDFALIAVGTDLRGYQATSAPVHISVFAIPLPVILCPTNITVPATETGSAIVHFAPQLAEGHDPSLALSCVPPSGSPFSVGQTIVRCLASDALTNEHSCLFLVTVLPSVLTLQGPNPLTQECHAQSNDPGATAIGGPIGLAGGFFHSAALTRDGTVVAWGDNRRGQTNVPAGLSNVVSIAAGYDYSLVLRSDGRAATWGLDGQLAVIPGVSNIVAISAGSAHGLALKANATVVGWGGAYGLGQEKPPRGLSNVVAIAAGETHSLALKADGMVVAWGGSTFGLTNVPPGLSQVKAIAASAALSLALKADGTVVAWGSDLFGESTVPEGLSNVVAIAAGAQHGLALTADGRVVAWGLNNAGQVNVPPTLTNAFAIAAGIQHSLALTRDGYVFAWGRGDFGQINVPPSLTTNLTDRIVVSGPVYSEEPGTYVRTYRVTDLQDYAWTKSRTVTVLDTTPPTINCGANRTVECGIPWGFDLPTAMDACSKTNVAIIDWGTATNVTSGRMLMIARTWQATDPSGNTATCSQTITVADTTPPEITCPANVTLEFTGATGAVARFAATATDSCDVAVSVVCMPPSESVFPIGQTPVRCMATDASRNAGTCIFTVTVQGARGLKENVLAELTAWRATITRREDTDMLDDAIKHLTQSLAPELWVDQTHLERKHGDRAIQEEKESVRKLCDLAKDRKSTVPAEVLGGFIDRITSADRLLAAVAIADATAAGAARKKIEHANEELAKGDADVANPKCGDGLENYKQAWKLATRAKLTGAIHLRGGRLQLEILGEPGETYVIQASSNLMDWVTLGARTADADGVVRFEEADSGKVPARFYRVVSL